MSTWLSLLPKERDESQELRSTESKPNAWDLKAVQVRGGKLEQYAGAGRQITKNDAKKQSV